MDTPPTPPIPDEELQRRVIFSMLLPAVRLARLFGLPLKELSKWLETAYFHELRTNGQEQTLREIAGALSVSERTAAKLSKQLRERFMLPETQHNLVRRIEFLLGTEAMSEARLLQLIPDAEPKDIRQTLSGLREQGRLREVVGRTVKLELTRAVHRLPRDTWIARVGALNSFAENLTNATFGRFFRDESRAFARTVTFHAEPGTFDWLPEFYETEIVPGLKARMRNSGAVQADDASAELSNPTSSSEAVQLSLCWAPYQYTDQTNPQGDDEA